MQRQLSHHSKIFLHLILVMDALKNHWPEYLIEGACLGLFMISAFSFGTIFEHPASPVYRALPNPLLRRFLLGLAMGGTAISIIYSPWGKRSGAHINPSTTLTFFRLGKIKKCDALLYIACQFLGGLLGALGRHYCSISLGIPPGGELPRDGARPCRSFRRVYR